MKIQISYICDKNKGIGICVCEGKTGWRRRDLDGSYRTKKFLGKSGIFLAVMCRAAAEKSIADASVMDTLAAFQRWFQEELPELLSRFSFDTVKCYWRELVADRAEELAGVTPNMVALLVFQEHFLFCSTGDISVYEYSYREERVRHWQSIRERMKADRDLGVSEEEHQKLYFKCRKLSDSSLFLIVPEQIHVENPKMKKRKKALHRFAQSAAYLTGAAIAVKCGEG